MTMGMGMVSPKGQGGFSTSGSTTSKGSNKP